MNDQFFSQRIYLRPLTLNDVSQKYCDWLNDPQVNQFLETRQTTLNQLKKYVSDQIADPKSFLIGIFDKENNNHIGNVKFYLLDEAKKRADFGIIIGDKNYWQAGFGTEATKLAIDYGFKILGFNEIELGVLAENIRGQKAFSKAGFKPITVKKNYANHNGIWHDAILMEIKKYIR
ncbi:MAG: hypothetical protein A2729_04125 [Candidatus Buchananbacteria bacterium RIFCSPHIGHO2_01_FULL_39_14]|uniref:N-acetyltransferase domain-containing protein n=1 Tax=Candidatus Buchananbacteria bacterium RIFCSPHIGHO2_01_FULL_39_14 TaxID=1797532 RepID=A0A1G1XZF2_9BACT|nr:MAG: hypothetical protein A2729_04125 [Candidatus Buchananbacteria bacterium RIFCSPHIGHO2_01_FULL_39_14]OGY48655.1 MAG: hypothetical protein A3D39_05320 [Candidatus Buchananbacteria bacterium RIFCSPHIGHO2_02_FULL_39_17]